jgi:hypothetical protein
VFLNGKGTFTFSRMQLLMLAVPSTSFLSAQTSETGDLTHSARTKRLVKKTVGDWYCMGRQMLTVVKEIPELQRKPLRRSACSRKEEARAEFPDKSSKKLAQWIGLGLCRKIML